MDKINELLGSVAAALGGGFSELWVMLHVDRDGLPEGLDSDPKQLVAALRPIAADLMRHWTRNSCLPFGPDFKFTQAGWICTGCKKVVARWSPEMEVKP